ncbi:maleylacetoacetate isomerase [Phenylobacterium sp.]|jgi:maleylacetoacetate isomerase/maleylpyruvate isomerase|uniref:maleylacetoacetate isomerase n=1 Tax=Phenylobacterium sp. TaxID=1871053 RepID=UPI002E340B0B|nr:maleylacetoacetate isomerase [Phenylobacterium sp.]HEX3366750.1 maleylacetoacetate isomerase [Phenylobacterium sp.]
MPDQPSLVLYGFWRSMAAYRVRVALALKGVAVRELAIDLDAGEQFAPDFLAVNPEGAVPALIEPGQAPLTQSMAILEYLEERYPQPALLPADLRGRARVRSLAALVVSDTHPLIVPRVRTYLAAEAGLGEAAVHAWSTHWVARGLAAMETRLAGASATGAFCHGDSVTFADICLGNLGIAARNLRIDLAQTPTVARIIERCDALEAFANAHPSRQLGAPG